MSSTGSHRSRAARLAPGATSGSTPHLHSWLAPQAHLLRLDSSPPGWLAPEGTLGGRSHQCRGTGGAEPSVSRLHEGPAPTPNASTGRGGASNGTTAVGSSDEERSPWRPPACPPPTPPLRSSSSSSAAAAAASGLGVRVSLLTRQSNGTRQAIETTCSAAVIRKVVSNPYISIR